MDRFIGENLMKIIISVIILLYPLTITATVQPLKSQNILNLHYRFPHPGGIETHVLMANKVFAQRNTPHTLLTSKHSEWIVNRINQPKSPYGPPCYLLGHDEFFPTPTDVLQACQQKQISTIICNWIGHLDQGIESTKTHPADLIYMHHVPVDIFSPIELQKINQAKGIVAVSPIMTNQFKTLQKMGIITIKHIEHIGPFWDEDKFLQCKPTRSRQEFFKQAFNLDIPTDLPLVCSVANFAWYKNHPLLLKAVSILINQKQKKFHLILAGEGVEKKNLEALINELNIAPYVHLLGKTQEVPELLHHVDIHVLASSNEPFGLTHVEAATMNKPFIAATGTGASTFINHGITGFIFENNNAQDLANRLEIVIDNKVFRERMGQDAFTFVRINYSNQVLFNKWMNFLKKIEGH